MKPLVGILVISFLGGCSSFSKLTKLSTTPAGPAQTRGMFEENGISFYIEDFESKMTLKDAERHMVRHAMYREGAKLYRTPHGIYVVSKKGASITGYNSNPAIPVWVSAETAKGNCIDTLRKVSNSAASTLCDGGVPEEIKPVKGVIDLNGRVQFDLPPNWFTMDELLGSSPSNILVTVTYKGANGALCNVNVSSMIQPSGKFKGSRFRMGKKDGSLFSLQSDRKQDMGIGFKTKAGTS